MIRTSVICLCLCTILLSGCSSEADKVNKLKENAKVSLQENDFDEAINQYNELLKIKNDPAYIEEKKQIEVKQIMYHASLYVSKGKIGEAISWLESKDLTTITDELKSKLSNLQEILKLITSSKGLAAQNKFDDAIKSYSAILNIDTNDYFKKELDSLNTQKQNYLSAQLSIQQDKEKVKKLKEQTISLLKKKKYREVDSLLWNFSIDTSTSWLMDYDSDLNALRYYSSAKSQMEQEKKQYQTRENTDFQVGNILAKIPVSYTGIYSKEILQYKLWIKSKSEWLADEEMKASTEAYIAEKAAKSDPAIGMSKNEIRMSKWGDPDDINTTETEFGINEQWVYDSEGYIYFEDGTVTAIQR